MFVASYARLRPVRGSILASTFKFSLATHYIGFLRYNQALGWVWTVYYSARYHLGTTSLRLGPFNTMRGPASSITSAVPPRCRSRPLLQCVMRGTASALHCNARQGLGTARTFQYTVRGTALVPLGPSVTQCSTGMAEAHLEYNAGLVISIGSKGRRLSFGWATGESNRCLTGWDSFHPTFFFECGRHVGGVPRSS